MRPGPCAPRPLLLSDGREPDVICRNGHEQGQTVVYNANGYETYCTTCGVQLNAGMRPVEQPTYPPHMLIGAGIVLAAAVFLVGMVFWQMWLS